MNRNKYKNPTRKYRSRSNTGQYPTLDKSLNIHDIKSIKSRELELKRQRLPSLKNSKSTQKGETAGQSVPLFSSNETRTTNQQLNTKLPLSPSLYELQVLELDERIKQERDRGRKLSNLAQQDLSQDLCVSDETQYNLSELPLSDLSLAFELPPAALKMLQPKDSSTLEPKNSSVTASRPSAPRKSKKIPNFEVSEVFVTESKDLPKHDYFGHRKHELKSYRDEREYIWEHSKRFNPKNAKILYENVETQTDLEALDQEIESFEIQEKFDRKNLLPARSHKRWVLSQREKQRTTSPSLNIYRDLDIKNEYLEMIEDSYTEKLKEKANEICNLKKQLDNSKLKNDMTQSYLQLLKKKMFKMKSEEMKRLESEAEKIMRKRDFSCQISPTKVVSIDKNEDERMESTSSVSLTRNNDHYVNMIGTLRQQYIDDKLELLEEMLDMRQFASLAIQQVYSRAKKSKIKYDLTKKKLLAAQEDRAHAPLGRAEVSDDQIPLMNKATYLRRAKKDLSVRSSEETRQNLSKYLDDEENIDNLDSHVLDSLKIDSLESTLEQTKKNLGQGPREAKRASRQPFRVPTCEKDNDVYDNNRESSSSKRYDDFSQWYRSRSKENDRNLARHRDLTKKFVTEREKLKEMSRELKPNSRNPDRDLGKEEEQPFPKPIKAKSVIKNHNDKDPIAEYQVKYNKDNSVTFREIEKPRVILERKPRSVGPKTEDSYSFYLEDKKTGQKEKIRFLPRGRE